MVLVTGVGGQVVIDERAFALIRRTSIALRRRAGPGSTLASTASWGRWRTYLALHATFLSLPAGDLREDVQAALVRSERGFIAQIAGAYEQWAGLLGYRLRPELSVTFETMATLLNATMRGLVLTAPSVPDIATQRIQATPFETAGAEWSQPALGIATIALGFLEPDPIPRYAIPRYDWHMKVDKLSVSFDPDLGDAVRTAARQRGEGVSRWLADAAAVKLRTEALAAFLDDWEAEHGSLTAAELAKAATELALPKPTTTEPAA